MSTALLLTALALAGSPSSDRFDFDARLAAGIGTRLDQSAQSELVLEAGILFRIRLDGRRSGLVPTLLPEISVGVLTRDRTRDDLVIIGCGYGWTTGPLVLGFVPGFVIGDLRGDEPSDPRRLGAGLRLMAIAELTHFIGIQAGYIGAYNGDSFRNELFATVSLNFLGLAAVYVIGKTQ